MKKETPINTYGDDDWATPSEEEELKLTFSDWIKRQLTAEQVEDKLKNIQKKESSESVVILTKGTKW